MPSHLLKKGNMPMILPCYTGHYVLDMSKTPKTNLLSLEYAFYGRSRDYTILL